MKDESIKILAKNRKASFNFLIEDSLECGIELKGTEVKSVKGQKFSFSDSYAKIENKELFLVGFHINTYIHGNKFNHDPDRTRKLLAHKQEIKRLKRKIDEKGLTLVPLKFYLKFGIVKCELGICRGKHNYDKREHIKNRDLDREAEREIRRNS